MLRFTTIAAILTLIGCASPTPPATGENFVKAEEGKADSSVEAVFLHFEFDGEMFATRNWGLERQIEEQLLYTVGQLNGENSVGRLDLLELSDVTSERLETGGYTVRYHASMPVAWGRRSSVPTTYTFRLPRDMSFDGQEAFTEAYSQTCVDFSAHDVDVSSMWYYYRPDAFRCAVDASHVFDAKADVVPSDLQTTGKYPEYDKIWEDDVFRVVAVYGKYEDGATEASDAGIAAYNRFVRLITAELEAHGPVTEPADVPSDPGVDVPDVAFTADLGEGRSVEVVALLVDNVRTAGPTFDARYAALSSRADLIVYNGHSGLGANIKALARKGRWIEGQYAVVFMNGCDTYAYVDSALADAHAAVNPDDAVGTKYVDLVMNAMPSYFRSTANATMALIRGLSAYDEPQTYEQIFRDIDRAQVVLVSGEQDNTYVPGGDEPPAPDTWEGMRESGTVARGEEHRFETPVLPEGRYVFDMDGTRDADLYVRVGNAPTTRLYDCRPYRSGSAESCAVDLPAAGKIHVMVRGYASSSTYELAGAPAR